MIDVVIMASLEYRRDWLERLLRTERSLHLAGITPTFPSLRSLLDDIDVDAAVVDMVSTADSEMSGMTRDWLTELFEIVPVLVLASTPDSWTFNSMLRVESGALLRADATAEQIIRAIDSTSAGLLTIDSSLVPQTEPEEPSEELTPREVEVLRLLAEGFANREIATRLDISEHTIKFHIRSILGKLQASSRTEAVTRGLRAGLIEL